MTLGGFTPISLLWVGLLFGFVGGLLAGIGTIPVALVTGCGLGRPRHASSRSRVSLAETMVEHVVMGGVYGSATGCLVLTVFATFLSYDVTIPWVGGLLAFGVPYLVGYVNWKYNWRPSMEDGSASIGSGTYAWVLGAHAALLIGAVFWLLG